MGNAKKRVVLATINPVMTRLGTLPLSLLYLKSYAMADRKIRARAVFSIDEFDWGIPDEQITGTLLCKPAFLIGFSCYVWNYDRILRLVNQIKEISPDTSLLLGGPEVSFNAEEILLKNPHVDAVARGEATFRDYLRFLLYDPDKVRETAGLSYRLGLEVFRNPDREPLKRLDSIPSPYKGKLRFDKRREFPIETHRGCVFRCHFCSYPKAFERLRFFSLRRVRSDLKYLLGKKVKKIYLMDPVFNIERERAKDILRFIIRHNKHSASIHTELKAELVDREMADLLVKAGARHIEIGLQSTSKNVLRRINRKLSYRKFKEGLSLLGDPRINTEVGLILGLPGDNPETLKKSVDAALALGARTVKLFTLSVLPGTYIHKNAARLGISYDKFGTHPILQGRNFSRETIERFRMLDQAILYTQRSRAFRYLASELGLKLVDIFLLFANHLVKRCIPPDFINLKLANKEAKTFLTELISKEVSLANRVFYKSLLEKEFQ